MRVHVLQHVPFEGLGSMAACVQAPDALASAPASAYMDLNRLMGDLLAYLTRDIG